MLRNGYVVHTLEDGSVKIEGQAPMSASDAEAFLKRITQPVDTTLLQFPTHYERIREELLLLEAQGVRIKSEARKKYKLPL